MTTVVIAQLQGNWSRCPGCVSYEQPSGDKQCCDIVALPRCSGVMFHTHCRLIFAP